MSGTNFKEHWFDPWLPVYTPLGDAMAMSVRDYGMGHHDVWRTFIIETGEVWSFQNPYIRIQTSITDGRTKLSPFGEKAKQDFHWSPEFEGE